MQRTFPRKRVVVYFTHEVWAEAQQDVGNLVASEAFCSNASRTSGSHGYESVHTERERERERERCAVGQRGEALP